MIPKGAAMKNFLPIIIGALIITAALAVVFRSNTKQTASTTAQEQPTVSVSPTDVPSNVQASPTQALANGITLTVSAPANNTTVTSATITVVGKTVPGAEVFVNDKDTKADAKGNFSVSLPLDEGDNYILVVSNDDLGNYSEKELNITYTP